MNDETLKATGHGGGGNALQRWTSSSNIDVAAALGMIRQHPADIGPEALTWRCSDDASAEERIAAWLELRVRIWAQRQHVRTRNPDNLPDAIAAATRSAMRNVRLPGTATADQLVAKEAGIRRHSFSELRRAGERFLRAAILASNRRLLEALGPWDKAEGVNPYPEEMDQTTPEPDDFATFAECLRACVGQVREQLVDAIADSLTRLSRAYVVQGLDNLVQRPIGLGCSYPKGSLGILGCVGLVVASRDTDPLTAATGDEWGRPVTGAAAVAAGWQIIVPAFEEIGFRLENDAEHPAYVLFCLDIGDEPFRYRLRAPGVYWLGPWQPQPYERNDAVTHGDDMWRAVRDTKAAPGAHEDWEEWWPPTAEENRAAMEARNTERSNA